MTPAPQSAFDAVDVPPVRVDLDLAGRFLDALEPGGLFTFQTFDDSRAKGPALARVLHARDLLDVAPQLAALNEAGAGVFVTVNRTDGRGRKAENVVGLRAVFVDADDVPRPATWHAPPNLIAWRDATHWHAYWKVDPATPLDRFTPMQKRLAAFYGTDPKVSDLSRVMRVPGFLHRKATPILIQVEVFNRGR